jgi:hypothetical protein
VLPNIPEWLLPYANDIGLGFALAVGAATLVYAFIR